MLTHVAPTSQKADVRPIAFVLQYSEGFYEPITLTIRPEELTLPETSRATVHQTLGRGTIGWVDNFGEALPSVNISGHTGWRARGPDAEDGVVAFLRLNQMVMIDYHKAKQDAIDSGIDPASVKLLFVDMLDERSWNVVPTSFVLRRSKSRPLLMQYNIALQALSTSIDDPAMDVPLYGNVSSGLTGLASLVGRFGGYSSNMGGWVSASSGFGGIGALGGIAAPFMRAATGIFQGAYDAVRVGGAAALNALALPASVAAVGVSAFRTVSAVAGLPIEMRGNFCGVAGGFNEARCLMSNSLRPRGTFEDFSGLYGASNCSSTTGGRPASIYADTNVFELLATGDRPRDSGMLASISAITRSDPVLSPMPLQEMARHLSIITPGLLSA